MKSLIIFLFSLISITSFSDDRKILSYEIEKNENANFIRVKITEETFKHRVVWGDTLSKLAKKLDTRIEKLARDNEIENIDLIYAGDDLIVEKRHSNYNEEGQEEKK